MCMEFVHGSARLVELWFTETVDDDDEEDDGTLVDVELSVFMLVIRRNCLTLTLPVFTVVLFVSMIFLSRKLPKR